jgi:hypothetical protein
VVSVPEAEVLITDAEEVGRMLNGLVEALSRS